MRAVLSCIRTWKLGGGRWYHIVQEPPLLQPTILSGYCCCPMSSTSITASLHVLLHHCFLYTFFWKLYSLGSVWDTLVLITCVSQSNALSTKATWNVLDFFQAVLFILFCFFFSFYWSIAVYKAVLVSCLAAKGISHVSCSVMLDSLWPHEQ